ncbi:MAG: DUF2937 family protein [Pseudomonadota bacterium]
MIIRTLALAAGLMTGLFASQFPEFSQQYVQRLGGAVDALQEVVEDFDASAKASGLSRHAALKEMHGTGFLESRRADMISTFARYERLRADLDALQQAGPFIRASLAPRFRDNEVARATFDAFRPALPLTFEGISFALLGLVLGAALVWAALRLLLWPVRRRGPA